MKRCLSCSAPLPANTNICHYCGTRNDVDLGRKDYVLHATASDRICPHCDQVLQTIDLHLQENFLIERCASCYGLFFDPGEIEALLESSVAGVFDINIQLLRNINKERYAKNQKVQYIKCPVCRNFMRRVNFGHRSGVVVDRCREHGVWLDNGEIAHLLEWKKAGGQMLHERQLRRERETGKNRKRESWRGSPVDVAAGHGYPELFSGRADEELLSMVSTAIFRLFR